MPDPVGSNLAQGKGFGTSQSLRSFPSLYRIVQKPVMVADHVQLMRHNRLQDSRMGASVGNWEVFILQLLVMYIVYELGTTLPGLRELALFNQGESLR